MQNIEFSPECDCEPRCVDQREHYRNNWWCPPCRWDFKVLEDEWLANPQRRKPGTEPDPTRIIGAHKSWHTRQNRSNQPISVAQRWQDSRPQHPEQVASEQRLRERGLLPDGNGTIDNDDQRDASAQTRRWMRDELLVALGLYLRLPFGQLHRGQPEIIACAELLGRTPSALAMKLVNLASLDDSLEQTGLRNTSQADREIWAAMQDDWNATAEAIAEAEVSFGVVPTLEIDDTPFQIGEDVVVPTKVRRGQDQFRKAVLSAYSFRCCITQLADPWLLEAAHIVPWRDGDPPNRLNPTNGLCLSVLHHRAFDHGLIALDSDFRLLLSPRLAERDDRFIETAFTPFAGEQIRLPRKFSPNPALLAHHREHTFLASG